MAAPLPIAYLDGAFLPLVEAKLSPLDRGFLFGDGVYEVIPAYGGRLFHLPAHLKRLQYSLDGIRLRNPLGDGQWTSLLQELVSKNGGGDQAVYLQVSRGADVGRDHSFPAKVPATVFAMSSLLGGLPGELKTQGARVVTLQDIFVFKQTGIGAEGKVEGHHEPTGVVPAFVGKLRTVYASVVVGDPRLGGVLVGR
jgi:D-alanine transaminase